MSRRCCWSKPELPNPHTLRLLNSSGTFQWERNQYLRGDNAYTSHRTNALAVSGNVIASGSVPPSIPESTEYAVVGWAPDGELLWTVNQPFGFISQILTLSNGNFVCADPSVQKLYGVRASDGALLWTSATLADSSGESVWARGQPMAANGTDIAVIGDNGTESYTFWRIDGTDGSTDFSDTYTLAAGFPLRGIILGGLGTYTAYRRTSIGGAGSIDGLDGDGDLTGTSFAPGSTPVFIAVSPAGNVLLMFSTGTIQEYDSSGTLQQEDTTTFGTRDDPALAIDNAGNIYAYGQDSSDADFSLLVKYDGDDLTTIDWQHSFNNRNSPLPADGSRALALHSPSSNPSPVIGYFADNPWTPQT